MVQSWCLVTQATTKQSCAANPCTVIPCIPCFARAKYASISLGISKECMTKARTAMNYRIIVAWLFRKPQVARLGSLGPHLGLVSTQNRLTSIGKAWAGGFQEGPSLLWVINSWDLSGKIEWSVTKVLGSPRSFFGHSEPTWYLFVVSKPITSILHFHCSPTADTLLGNENLADQVTSIYRSWSTLGPRKHGSDSWRSLWYQQEDATSRILSA